jgi:hypothetical protein
VTFDVNIRVLSKQEIRNAINEILNVSKKDQLLAILEALPSETGNDIKTSEVLKVSVEILEFSLQASRDELLTIRLFICRQVT